MNASEKAAELKAKIKLLYQEIDDLNEEIFNISLAEWWELVGKYDYDPHLVYDFNGFLPTYYFRDAPLATWFENWGYKNYLSPFQLEIGLKFNSCMDL